MKGHAETDLENHLVNGRTELVVLVSGQRRTAIFARPGISPALLGLVYSGIDAIEDGPGNILWKASA